MSNVRTSPMYRSIKELVIEKSYCDSLEKLSEDVKADLPHSGFREFLTILIAIGSKVLREQYEIRKHAPVKPVVDVATVAEMAEISQRLQALKK